MVPAGRLNQRVTFQAPTQTDDAGGGHSVAWGGDLTVWGAFFPERGRERVEGGRLQAALGGRLVVRRSSATDAITEGHRVLIGGEPYQIRSKADEEQRRAEYTFTVEKGVAQ